MTTCNTTKISAKSLVRFAQAWSKLGDNINEQVEMVLENPLTEDVNPNAIRRAQEDLMGLNEELDEALEDWMTNVAVQL